jgi:hypothetical protein
MLHSFKKLAAAAMLLLAAYGCKRETLTEQNVSTATNTPIHKVQQWLKNQPSPLSLSGRKVGTALPPNNLQWQKIKYSTSSGTYTIPAALAGEKKSNSFAQLSFVAKQNAQGGISSGQYMLVLPNHKKMGADAAVGYNYTLLAAPRPDAPPKGFSGAILYYSTAGLLTGSQVYDGGQLLPNATANLAARDGADGNPDPNTVILNCDGPRFCIDWYWQTYVNGVLTSELYLETTCSCTPEGAGGGGGGGGGGVNDGGEVVSGVCSSICANSAALASDVVGQEESNVSVSSGAASNPNLQGVIKKPKTLTLNFYKLSFFWGYYAHCSAIYTGVVYKLDKNDPNWKWESLRYVGAEITDGEIPPCTEVKPTVYPAPVVFSTDRRQATIDFVYNVKAYFSCGTPYVIHNRNSTYPGWMPFDAND